MMFSNEKSTEVWAGLVQVLAFKVRLMFADDEPMDPELVRKMLNLIQTVSCSIFNFTGVTWNMWSSGSQVHAQAKTGEKAQLTGCMVGLNCTVVDKTTLIGLSLGTGSRVEEKVKLSNCVFMENVVIENAGSNLEDSIICDNCTVSGKSSVKLSILGREQKTAEGTELSSQLVLDSERMTQV